MLHWRPRKQELLSSRACANSAALAWLCIPFVSLSVVPETHAASVDVTSPATSFVAGLVLGLVLLIGCAVVAHLRLTIARRNLRQANDLAGHREYERNLAQQ